MAETIPFDDFARLDLRVGTVLEAQDHPQADRLIVLKVDLGAEQRQLVAGLRGHYAAADLVGKQVVVVANLAPRMMRGVESRGMLLAACSADRSAIVLVCPERPIAPGSAVT